MKPTDDWDAHKPNQTIPMNTSDQTLVALLGRIKATVDPMEIRQLSDQIEQVIFNKLAEKP